MSEFFFDDSMDRVHEDGRVPRRPAVSPGKVTLTSSIARIASSGLDGQQPAKCSPRSADPIQRGALESQRIAPGTGMSDWDIAFRPDLCEYPQTESGAAPIQQRSEQDEEMSSSSSGGEIGRTQEEGDSWFSGALDWVQGGLDVASMALDATGVGGVVSWVPDVLNAGISAGRGDWTGAGLSVAAAVPFAGAAANATRLGRTVARHGDDVVDLGQAAEGASRVGSLPKPPRGKGSVPKSQRDPRRAWTPKERAAKRKTQGDECGTGCSTKIDQSNSRGHHKKRHADGGRTNDANHVEVCVDCHLKLHSPD